VVGPGPEIGLEADTILRLQAFGALADLEFDRLAFIQTTVTIRLDRRIVHEDIFSGLPLDEPIALAGVKLLHGSLFLHCLVSSSFSFSFLQN
jgi:hypothetical protein